MGEPWQAWLSKASQGCLTATGGRESVRPGKGAAQAAQLRGHGHQVDRERIVARGPPQATPTRLSIASMREEPKWRQGAGGSEAPDPQGEGAGEGNEPL